MKTQKWMLPLGMIAVFSFLTLAISGRLLWPGYDPVRSYTSMLLTNESPHVHLMRTFMNLYTICFCLFTFAVCVHAFRVYHACAKIGYAILFAVSFVSVLGYGSVPISMDLIFAANDLFHLAMTIFILSTTILAMILIAVGYLKQEKLRTMGKISLLTGVLFIIFNAWHVAAILSGQNILGLIQRLTFYSFHAFTFSISWIYTFKGNR